MVTMLVLVVLVLGYCCGGGGGGVLGNVCEDPLGPGGVVPPPKSLVRTEFGLGCSTQPNVTFDNDAFSDGDGPRGVHNASECCDLCASDDACTFWSFNVDPALPTTPGQCRWGALTYCCFLHTSDANASKASVSPRQFGAKGTWTSGHVYALPTKVRPPTGPTHGFRGEFVLSAASTAVVATDPRLADTAQVFADDLFSLSGVSLNVSVSGVSPSGRPLPLSGNDANTSKGSNVLFRLVQGSHPEQYNITVGGNGIDVACSDPTGCAWAASTLKQAVCISGVVSQQLAIPCMNVSDWPDAPWRTYLVDVARTEVTVSELKRAVVFCSFYKIRYLHLHLTDDHCWTFPSKAFPTLGSQNVGFRGPTASTYNESDLRDLVAFAEQRSVIVVPELEGPGHSGAMRRSDPFFQGEGNTNPQGGGVLNVANDSFYEAMDTIVGEIADVFHTSPYVHVGCDETGTPSSLPGYQQFVKEHGISGESDLFAYYVKAMADMVRKRNKTAILWGPASLTRLQPGDAVVMVWQGNDGPARDAIKLGLQVVNCPNEVGSLETEFARRLSDFLPPAPSGGASGGAHSMSADPLPDTSILGTQVNLWEKGWEWGVYDTGIAEIGRVAGPGWYGYTWPRTMVNVTQLAQAVTIAERTRGRLRPLCH